VISLYVYRYELASSFPAIIYSHYGGAVGLAR
jgi:hypothetical protein